MSEVALVPVVVVDGTLAPGSRKARRDDLGKSLHEALLVSLAQIVCQALECLPPLVLIREIVGRVGSCSGLLQRHVEERRN